MIRFIEQIIYPAKIKQLEAELKASRKATKFAVKFICDLQGDRVTNRDIQEFLCEVQKIRRV